MARTIILHTRGSSAPDGWDSSLVRLANPASSVKHPSRLWPGNSISWLGSDQRAGRHAGFGVSPESDYQLARERDNHDAPDPTLEMPTRR